MKSKEEVIQIAYGEYSDILEIDENGWTRHFMGTPKSFLEYHLKNKGLFDSRVENKPDMFLVFIRPKSLQGIESNNGWISINSEKDLPKDGYVFWVKRDGIDSPLYKAEEFFNAQINKEWLDSYTHYQPIVKPNPPLHK